MSKIAIVVDEAPNTVLTIAVLRQFRPDLGIAELRQRLASGAPVVEESLFMNNYHEVADRLHELLHALSETGAHLRFFELRPDETVERSWGLSSHEVSEETVRNILDSAKFYE